MSQRDASHASIDHKTRHSKRAKRNGSPQIDISIRSRLAFQGRIQGRAERPRHHRLGLNAGLDCRSEEEKQQNAQQVVDCKFSHFCDTPEGTNQPYVALISASERPFLTVGEPRFASGGALGRAAILLRQRRRAVRNGEVNVRSVRNCVCAAELTVWGEWMGVVHGGPTTFGRVGEFRGIDSFRDSGKDSYELHQVLHFLSLPSRA